MKHLKIAKDRRMIKKNMKYTRGLEGMAQLAKGLHASMKM